MQLHYSLYIKHTVVLLYLKKICELGLAGILRLLVEGEPHSAGVLLLGLLPCCLEEPAPATEYICRCAVASVQVYSVPEVSTGAGGREGSNVSPGMRVEALALSSMQIPMSI